MREIALSTITTMLAIYTAILVIAWQHVSDRYTPKLLLVFLRRAALKPLAGFIALLLASGVLVLHPLQQLLAGLPTHSRLQVSPLVGDFLAFLLLLGSVGIVVWASYKLARYLTDGRQLIPLLHDEENQQAALQEILLNTIQRGDQLVTASALHAALSGGLSEKEVFLAWLTEHGDLLSTDWLIRVLRLLLLSADLDPTETSIYTNLLLLLLTKALDNEEFPRAQEVMRAIIDALERTTAWEQVHADLIERMGFALWKIGEIDAYAMRTSRIPSQLTNIQKLFVGEMRSLWFHIRDMNSQDAMQVFCSALAKLAFVTREGELACPFFGTIHEVMERGFSKHLFTKEIIHELVSTLGYMQLHPDGYEEATQERIDALVYDLCVMFGELGGSKEALHQLVEQGGLLARSNKQGGLNIHTHTWLGNKSYQTVALVLKHANPNMHPINTMLWDGRL